MRHVLAKTLRAVVTLLLAFTASAVAVAAAPVGFEVNTFYSGLPFARLSGMVVDATGTLYVADWGDGVSTAATVHKMDLASKAVFTLPSTPPLSQPSRLLIGDGRTLTGTDLIISDYNAYAGLNCCNGSVWRVDRASYTWTLLASGNPVTAVGDPYGLALGPGGAFGPGLYVMDFQGASPDRPLLFRILTQDGTAYSELFPLLNPEVWTIDREPMDIAFGNPGFPGVLFVRDAATTPGTPPTIWSVDSNGAIGAFLEFSSGDPPIAMKFAPGGTFGTNLYVLTQWGRLLEVLPDRTTHTIARGIPTWNWFTDLAFSPDGSRLFATWADTIFEIVAPAERRIAIDIKPDTTTNSINMGSHGNFVVAILSSADFDATKVDLGTVTLAGAPVARRPNGTMMASIGDVNGDGKRDLLVHIVTDQLQLDSGDDSAVLKGMTASGGAFWGIDSVRLVP